MRDALRRGWGRGADRDADGGVGELLGVVGVSPARTGGGARVDAPARRGRAPGDRDQPERQQRCCSRARASSHRAPPVCRRGPTLRGLPVERVGHRNQTAPGGDEGFSSDPRQVHAGVDALRRPMVPDLTNAPERTPAMTRCCRRITTFTNHTEEAANRTPAGGDHGTPTHRSARALGRCSRSLPAAWSSVTGCTRTAPPVQAAGDGGSGSVQPTELRHASPTSPDGAGSGGGGGSGGGSGNASSEATGGDGGNGNQAAGSPIDVPTIPEKHVSMEGLQ